MSKILVPVDGSDNSDVALEYAFELFPDGEIHAVNVIQVTAIPDDPQRSPIEIAEERSAEIIGNAERIASKHDRTIHTATLHNSATDGILKYADDNDMDQIIMGSKGESGLKRVLLGSVAETVVRRAQIPVTVVR